MELREVELLTEGQTVNEILAPALIVEVDIGAVLAGDFDRDGDTDFNDFFLFADQFGASANRSLMYRKPMRLACGQAWSRGHAIPRLSSSLCAGLERIIFAASWPGWNPTRWFSSSPSIFPRTRQSPWSGCSQAATEQQKLPSL